MRNKTKCGLRRAHLCICAKNVFESKCGRKARVLQEEVILVGDHPRLWFPSDQASWVKKIKRDLR